ncbi:hypothetical protein HDU97_010176 [Phlyctochytrium planicorne]|nr:hypothetical protein HDU97_010176 [Phlyctochytrium planicorne]
MENEHQEETNILEGLLNIRKGKSANEGSDSDESDDLEEEDDPMEEAKPFRTFKVERLELLDRVASFLPKLKEANEELTVKLEKGITKKEDVDIESVEPGARHIEMDLGVGVFDVELNVDDAVKRKKMDVVYKDSNDGDDMEITELKTSTGGKKPIIVEISEKTPK